jgi:hypothetical protein
LPSILLHRLMHNLCHGTIYSSFAGGLSHFSFFVDQLFSSPNVTLFQLDYGQITATQLGLILRIKKRLLENNFPSVLQNSEQRLRCCCESSPKYRKVSKRPEPFLKSPFSLN